MTKPVGWADIATKSDLAHFEKRMDLRFDNFEARLNLRNEDVDPVLEKTIESLKAMERSVICKVLATYLAGVALLAVLEVWGPR